MIPRPAPITDSPLFWVLLFGSVGLVLLTAIEPKYIKRQERIARMQHTRERVRAGQVADGQPREDSPQPVKRATLRPLMLFLAMLLIAAMLVMQVRRQKAMSQYRRALAAQEEGTHS